MSKSDSEKQTFSRKNAVSWLIGAGLPLLFALVVIGSLAGVVPLLITVLLVIIGLGILNRKRPDFFAALKKKRPDKPDYSSVRMEVGPRQASKRTYMMLVGLNAYNQYRVTINESPFTIGRDKSCSFQLDNDQVSNHHLTINFNEEDKLCYITDNNSSNGTFLNSVRLPARQKKALHQGDSLQIAGIIFSVEYVHY